MNLSYRYRIYPNTVQREALDNIFSFCRFLYNNALEERISYYKRFGKSLTYNSQTKELPSVKEVFCEAKSIHSQVLQSVLKQVDFGFQNFFRNLKKKSNKAGFPRFKNKDRFRSICFSQCNLISGGVKRLPNNKLKLFNIPGEIKVIWHRPFQGRCKQVRIVKSNEKYYIILVCVDIVTEHRTPTGKEIAIDLGIESFITTDKGIKFHHPKPYKTAKEKLAYLQRRRAAKQRGSNNDKKLKLRIAKQYEKITNIRKDFQHKVAKQLVDDNYKIYIEKLNIKSMLESKGFEVRKENITEASWGNFVALLEYKAEKAGALVIKVDPRNTSKTCSQCLKVKEKLALSERTYHCEACGFEMDRDQNAALNIRRVGTTLTTTNSVVIEAFGFSQK